ncbi:MAG: hypothetical protein NTV34_17040 [Proteobacteria bacterium]|nr:hypothetical protein [Pseudomonadota bacterium]
MKLLVTVENVGLKAVVRLEGPIDESVATCLMPLLKIPNGPCVFDMSKISSINSLGVRAWINVMRSFRDTHDISFQKCPADIVMQVNAIPSFAGSAGIESIFASFFCTACSASTTIEFNTLRPYNDVSKEYNSQLCPTCSAPLEGEEPAEVFLHFLKKRVGRDEKESLIKKV